MNEFVYKLTLDLNCAKIPPVICSGQFDKGRKFEFTITANGDPFDVTGCSAVLKGIRSDKSHFAVECTTTSNSKITKTLDDTTLSVRGKTVAKLVISDSSKSYSTQMFIIDVDSALDGDITVADDYSVLNRLIEQIHSLNESGAILVDDTINESSNNAVANSAVAKALNYKADTADVYTVNEANERFLNKKEALENKISDKESITDMEDNYPSLDFLYKYFSPLDEVDNKLAEKADASDVENSLAEKADVSDVESALAEKADKVEVENSLAEKANKTEVDESLSGKEAINNKITDKRFITDSKANYPSIAFLEDYYYNVDEIDALLNGKDISTNVSTALAQKANIADVYEIKSVSNILKISQYSNTINGITVTVDANNHLTISGTASKYTLIQDIPVNCILETGANYTLSTQNSAKLGTNDTNVSIALGGHTSSSILTINYEGQDTSKTFTAETNNVEFLWLQVALGKTANVECDIQLEKGEEYTEFISPNTKDDYISKLSLQDGSVSKEKLSEELQSKTNLLPKMNYIYVSNSFTNADEGFGLTKFNSILAANNSITDNSEFNRYTIIVKAGTYNEFEETYSGSTDTEKLQGIETKNYVYYESENINNPSECVLSWDGSVGYEEGDLTDEMAIQKCIFHIKGGGYLEEGMHTHIKGFTITSKNTRYGLHIESGGYGRNVNWLVENCIIEYGGRPNIANSALQPVIGMGMSPFECGEIRKCVIKYSDGTTWNPDTDMPKAIVCHNNSDTTIYTNKPPVIAGAELNIKDCKFNDNTVTFSTKPNTVLSDTKFTVHLDNNVGISSVDNSEAWLLTDGANSYTPVKGVDYFTEEDKAELVEAVYALIADGNEVAY